MVGWHHGGYEKIRSSREDAQSRISFGLLVLIVFFF